MCIENIRCSIESEWWIFNILFILDNTCTVFCDGGLCTKVVLKYSVSLTHSLCDGGWQGTKFEFLCLLSEISWKITKLNGQNLFFYRKLANKILVCYGFSLNSYLEKKWYKIAIFIKVKMLEKQKKQKISLKYLKNY